ncbi:MAG: squalene synthase HpnC [Thermoguttaceae bacterium]
MSDGSFRRDLQLYGPEAADGVAPSMTESQRYCRRLARRHYENFTVGGLVVPREARRHVANVYAYCRWADDLADETANPGQSLRLLDWWQEELDACYQGRTRHPVFVALRETIDHYAISRQPLADLLAAFRQDQVVRQWERFDDLLDYCRCSAHPVGRIVLSMAGCGDTEATRLSDSICTGLQLANFWQDVARDWKAGRVYLPLEDCRRFGVEGTSLGAAPCTDAFRELLAMEVERAEHYLREGLPLVDRMPRPWRLSVALFAYGGLEILKAIRRLNYDVLSRRPTLSQGAKLALVVRCWWRRFGNGSGRQPS